MMRAYVKRIQQEHVRKSSKIAKTTKSHWLGLSITSEDIEHKVHKTSRYIEYLRGT